MSTRAPLSRVFQYIDDNSADYIQLLREAVAIKSVSAWAGTRPQVIEITQWAEKQLKALGATTQLRELGDQTFPDGTIAPLPPVLLGTLGTDPKKKTVLIYGHLDVQPALQSDGWDTDPFVLTEKDDKMYGRGASDDKGPVLAWINAVRAFQAVGMDLQVNLKFVLEAMEEVGSLGLHELIRSLKTTFLKDVDYNVISDNYWLADKPCLTYGLRGLAYFLVQVSCAKKDLHSGVYGGLVYEAMPDLIYLLDSLVDKEGNILVDGIMDDVDLVQPAEEEIYKRINFDVADLRASIGCNTLRYAEEKDKLLMGGWRYPSLSIHGVEGAFYEAGAKTVIPAKVIGKFSIRLVPHQTPEKVIELVNAYLQKKWAERDSKNEMTVSFHHGGNPWVENPYHENYQAGARAIKQVYNIEPDLTREGCSIPIAITLQEATGKNVLLLPLGASDDGAHSQNEKMNIVNYILGTKMLGAYLYEVGQIP